MYKPKFKVGDLVFWRGYIDDYQYPVDDDVGLVIEVISSTRGGKQRFRVLWLVSRDPIGIFYSDHPCLHTQQQWEEL